MSAVASTIQAPARAGFNDTASFDLAQRGAKLLAVADLMPQRFKGKVADCMIVLEMAQRLGANPLMVAQNLYVVHGTPAWSAQFVISCINNSGRFSALRYEVRGTDPKKPDYAVRAWAIERATDERLEGPWVDWGTVKGEGWDGKQGSKWKTIPDMMFRYRAAAWWGRTYAPELTMGLRLADEEREIVDITPVAGADVMAEINAQISGPASVDADGVIDLPADDAIQPAQVAQMIDGATDADTLAVAAGMIDDIADPVAIADLVERAEGKARELDNKA